MLKTKNYITLLLVVFMILSSFAFGGVYADWVYVRNADPLSINPSLTLSNFHYGEIYIVSVEKKSSPSDYTNADMKKISTTTVDSDITLSSSASSSVSFDITFYNSTDTVYYYNEAKTVSTSNDKIKYEVGGIVQKDAVAPKTYKTVTVTFSYDSSVPSNKTSETEIFFHFVVDKDSIGIVVARTAVDRFRDVLNNVAFEGSYSMLDTAMNNRSGYNAASDVTFIGNVSGSTSSDTQTMETLFGDEFMSMDLDGDGKPEPITMMIKRENLDANDYTGADYSYTTSSWWQTETRTVYGVEMTLYITSADLDSVRTGTSVVVYAATFTKPEGESEWVELVPLTKGKAPANNYTSGDYGSNANSFNTSKWTSDANKTIKELVSEAIAN